jgi:hypothetical protein
MCLESANREEHYFKQSAEDDFSGEIGDSEGTFFFNSKKNGFFIYKIRILGFKCVFSGSILVELIVFWYCWNRAAFSWRLVPLPLSHCHFLCHNTPVLLKNQFFWFCHSFSSSYIDCIWLNTSTVTLKLVSLEPRCFYLSIGTTAIEPLPLFMPH